MTHLLRTTAACLAALAFTAQANSVVNGGFETGDLTGWTTFGDTSFDGVDTFSAQSGSYGAFFGSDGASGISQAFATSAGSYTVTFMLSLQDSATPNAFSWAWNGVTQAAAFTDATAFGYQAFTAQVTASAGMSTLSFSFSNPQSFWLLDNVDVSPVPEPSSLLLLGGGLAVLLRRPRLQRQCSASGGGTTHECMRSS